MYLHLSIAVLPCGRGDWVRTVYGWVHIRLLNASQRLVECGTITTSPLCFYPLAAGRDIYRRVAFFVFFFFWYSEIPELRRSFGIWSARWIR